MSEEMCVYCQLDSAGNHAFKCPLNPSNAANQRIAISPAMFVADARDSIIASQSAEIETLKSQLAKRGFSVKVIQMDKEHKALGCYALGSVKDGDGWIMIDFAGVEADDNLTEEQKKAVIANAITHEVNHALADFFGLEPYDPDGMCGGTETEVQQVLYLEEHEAIVATKDNEIETLKSQLSDARGEIEMLRGKREAKIKQCPFRQDINGCSADDDCDGCLHIPEGMGVCKKCGKPYMLQTCETGICPMCDLPEGCHFQLPDGSIVPPLPTNVVIAGQALNHNEKENV